MTDRTDLTVGDAVQHLQWPPGTVCKIVDIRDGPAGCGMVAELDKLPYIPVAYDGRPLGDIETAMNKIWMLDGLVRFDPDLPDPLERLEAELTALREKAERLEGATQRAERKLKAYVGICNGDKELTDTVLPMLRAALEGPDDG